MKKDQEKMPTALRPPRTEETRPSRSRYNEVGRRQDRDPGMASSTRGDLDRMKREFGSRGEDVVASRSMNSKTVRGKPRRSRQVSPLRTARGLGPVGVVFILNIEPAQARALRVVNKIKGGSVPPK